MYFHKTVQLIYILLLSALFIFLGSVSALSAESIGKLSSFSGVVLIQSQGAWGVEPKVGLPLYSLDKIVTRIGTATITFNDGAVMELKNNSNTRIEEKEEEEGIFTKVKVIKRNFRLLLGKMLFRTSNPKIQTRLETPTMVCGLRGTAGVISLDENGNPYIQFTDGGIAYINGDFFSGEAADLPQEIADLDPAQRMAFVAAAAADQAENALALAQEAAGTPQEAQAKAQAALASALAAKAAAEAAKEHASKMTNNPDPGIVQEANDAINQANAAIQAAEENIRKAIEDGAVPPPTEPSQTPVPPPIVIPPPGFDVPASPV